MYSAEVVLSKEGRCQMNHILVLLILFLFHAKNYEEKKRLRRVKAYGKGYLSETLKQYSFSSVPVFYYEKINENEFRFIFCGESNNIFYDDAYQAIKNDNYVRCKETEV